jgi:hypothetical protein
MLPLLVVFLDIWTRFFDFYLDNRTILPEPAGTDAMFLGLSVWDLAQAIGAFATAGALIAVIFQAKSMRTQTEMEYRLRPWLRPTEIGKHFLLLIKEWKEESKSGLELIVHKYFINEGSLPAKSFIGFVTVSSNRIDDYKSYATTYPGHAIFGGVDFRIEGYSFLSDVEIIDNSKFSRPIHIGLRIEYEYGTRMSPRKGFYQGHFGVEEIQFIGAADYKEYLPYVMDREDDFG